MSALPERASGNWPAFFRVRPTGIRLSPALPLLGIAAALLLWRLATAEALHPESILAQFAPDACFDALLRLVRTGEIVPHMAASLRRVLLSLLFELLAGIPLGLLVGMSRSVERATGPLFQFIRMISPISWMQLAVMVFGIGDAPVYFLLTIAAV